QFYWWCGHVCLVCNTALYISSALSLNANPIYHTRAYMGALFSYATVISRSTGSTTWFSKEFFRDENVQYFALAFYWYSYQPMAGKKKERRERRLYSNDYHEKALQLAAYAEVVAILGRLIGGVLIFQTSVLALVVFIHFLRLRFYLSPYTRDAMYAVTHTLDELLLPPTAEPYVSPTVSRLYMAIRSIVIRYGVTAQSGPPPAVEEPMTSPDPPQHLVTEA
ncbi:hypothetical protein BDF14DRAFT_1715953, partial [Spinellus fusiger]